MVCNIRSKKRWFATVSALKGRDCEKIVLLMSEKLCG
jgi:hypothetical protein